MENKTMTTFTTQDRQDAQRTPLTDEQIDSESMYFMHSWYLENKQRLRLFARAIERAHGIGE